MKTALLKGQESPDEPVRAYLHSVEAVARLLTRDNRRLLALIRDCHPSSIAALAELSGRSQPNVARTLAKLQAIGFVAMETVGRQKSPRAVVRRVTALIDPYTEEDVITIDKET